VPTALKIGSLTDIVEDLESSQQAEWLIEGIWPARAYGIIGAAAKAGKTWAALDLAVSVVTGSNWLGRFPCASGAVLLLMAEGDERSIWRRLEAICDSRSVRHADILEGVDMTRNAPNLRDAGHLKAIEEQLARRQYALVIAEPLYLLAPGLQSSNLFEVGQVLREIQELSQGRDASLVVTTHFNQTGQGFGAHRFTGAGPAEWGRVLGYAEVTHNRTQGNATDVGLRWEFSGTEIAPVGFSMRRQVSEANGHLVYVVEAGDTLVDEAPASASDLVRRILDAVQNATEASPVSISGLREYLSTDDFGHVPSDQTIHRHMRALEQAGVVRRRSEGQGTPNLWWPAG
jgi:AAA domain